MNRDEFADWLVSGVETAKNPDEVTKDEYPTVVRGENNRVVLVRMEGLKSLVVSKSGAVVDGYPAAGYRVFEVAAETELSFAYEAAEGYKVAESAPTALTVNEDTVISPTEATGPTCTGGVIVPGAEAGTWVVTPDGNATEVAITGLPKDDSVVVPPTVRQVKGADDDKIIVKSGTHDITGAFTVSDGTIALNPEGVVKIGEKEIPVKPMIGEGCLVLGAGGVLGAGVSVSVKTIPGLVYELTRATALDAAFGSIGSGVKATGTGAPVTLTDDNPPADKAFYRVEVSAP